MMPRTLLLLVLCPIAAAAQPAFPANPYGDPLPEDAILRLGTLRFRPPSSSASMLAFSADGKFLATWGFAQSMNVLDVATGLEVPAARWSLPKGGAFIKHSLSRDGRLLSHNTGVDFQIWDWASGKPWYSVGERNEWLRADAFCPDSKTLVALQNNGTLWKWDVRRGKLLRRWTLQLPAGKKAADEEWDLAPACFSADASMVAARIGSDTTSREKTIRLWDVESGKQLHCLPGHGTDNVDFEFSPDGRYLLSQGGDGTIRLWDTKTGKERHRIAKSFKEEVLAFAFSPDGKLLVGAGPYPGNALRVWDLETGRERRRLQGPAGAVGELVFSPDGKTLAASQEGAIRLWDVDSGKRLGLSAKDPGLFREPFFSRDGKILFVGNSDEGVYAWDVANGRQRRLPGLLPVAVGRSRDVLVVGQVTRRTGAEEDSSGEGPFRRALCLVDPGTGDKLGEAVLQSDERLLGLSPDGKRILVGDGYLRTDARLIDVAGGKTIATPRAADSTGCAAAAEDLSLFALLSYGGIVQVVDGRTGKELRRLKGLTTGSLSNPRLLFAPDGQTLAAADGQQCIVWNVKTGAKLLHFGRDPWLVGFSPDSKHLLAVPSPHTEDLLACMEVATGKVRRLFKEADAGRPGDVVFSPDGKLMAGKAKGHEVQLWEALTGRPLRRFRGHKKEINRLHFSPDGRCLATESDDTTVIVWDVTGMQRDGRLPQLHPSAEELDALWSDLAGPARPAQRAVWRLAAAGQPAAALLARRLRPAPAVEQGVVKRLLGELDSDRFEEREKAARALAECEAAIPALRQALGDQPSVEVRQRLERILAQLDDPAGNPQRCRSVRALQVLEQLGTPEARALLQTLSKGAAGAHLTREANESLHRLTAGSRADRE